MFQQAVALSPGGEHLYSNATTDDAVAALLVSMMGVFRADPPELDQTSGSPTHVFTRSPVYDLTRLVRQHLDRHW
jgi:hypothetical protein